MRWVRPVSRSKTPSAGRQRRTGGAAANLRSLTPTADITGYVNLWQQMWNDDYVSAHQAMSGWGNNPSRSPGRRQAVGGDDEDNALVNDRLVIGGDRVHLSDITLPFLHVTADRDHIIPEKCSAPLVGLVGSPDAEQFRLPARAHRSRRRKTAADHHPQDHRLHAPTQ